MTRRSALVLVAALGLAWLLVSLAAKGPGAGTTPTPPATPSGTVQAATPPVPGRDSSPGLASPGASPVASESGALPPTESARAWGRITGPNGESLPGATISLWRSVAEGDGRLARPTPAELEADEDLALEFPPEPESKVEVLAKTSSDPTGRFELTLPPAEGELRWFQVEHPAHVPVESVSFESFTGEFEVALSLGSTLEVRLVGPGGAALSEPWVQVWVDTLAPPSVRARGLEFHPAEAPTQSEEDRPGTRRAKSNPSVFRGLSAGEVEVRARAQGCRGVSQTLTLAPGEARTIELQLDLGLHLSGTVRTPSGEPIPGAWVAVYPAIEADSIEALLAKTGADGSFLLPTGLGPDEHEVSVEAEGYLRWDGTLRRGETHLRVVLERTVRVAGRVVPTPSAEVLGAWSVRLVAESERDEGSHDGGLDSDGSFSFPNVLRGRYRLMARGPGLVSMTPLELRVDDHDLLGLELPLEAGFSAALRVRDEQGAPLAGAEVVEVSNSLKVSALDSGADGQAVLSGLAPGEHHLTVSKPGYVRARAILLVSPEGRAEPVEVVLRRGAELVLHLQDSGGRAIPNLRPYLHHQGNPADSQFVAGAGPHHLAPGTYAVSGDAETQAYSFGEVTLAAGEQLETTRTAQPLGEGGITGVVVRGGRPVAESWVSLSDEGTLLLFTRTSPEGRFAFPGLPAGVFELRASESSPLLVRLAPGQSSDVQLRLFESSAAGTILLPSGDPLSSEGITLVICSGGETSSVYSDATGRFRFDSVAPGHWALACRTRFGVAKSEFTLQPHQQLEGLVVQLAASARLELEVLRADGSPARGVEVEVFHADLRVYAAVGGGLEPHTFPAHRAGAGGRLRVDDLLAGRYVLRAMSATGEIGVAELELRAGESPTPAQLRLAPPAGLRVFAPAGTSFELRLGGELLRAIERGAIGAEESAQGVLFEGLPGGEADLRGQSPAGVPLAPRAVRLTPGAIAELDLR